MVYLDKIVRTYIFLHCRDAGMQNSDKALPSIGLTGQMLITLEPHGTF